MTEELEFVCYLGEVPIWVNRDSINYRGIYYWDGKICIGYPSGPVNRITIMFILLHEIAHRIQDIKMGGLQEAETRINYSGFRDNASNYYCCQIEVSASKYAVRKLREFGVSKKRIISAIELVFSDIDTAAMLSRLRL